MDEFIEIDLDNWYCTSCMVNISEISHMKLNHNDNSASLYMKNGENMCIKKYSYEKLLKTLKEIKNV